MIHGSKEFQEFINKLLKSKRGYVEIGSIKSKNKNNYTNKKQVKFRPDMNAKGSKEFGINIKRNRFDHCTDFNEMNC